ncbi:hypothetical protein Daus18300_012406 [Diaporthe australafricana]|uniref:Clr5 domain-containing protein n=1 Tax=Diaporthe australafricana TaxID=127596 RepID=A0ABR3W302_9PEZI
MPPSRAEVAGPKDEEWEHHRPEMGRLYMEKEWTLGQVQKYMEDQYSFIAKRNQFEKYFSKWRLVKNIDASTWSCIYLMVRDIKAAGKEAEVWAHGFKKSPETVERQTARYRNRQPGKLRSGVIVREAPSALSSQITVSLPFHAFVGALRNNLPWTSVKGSAVSSRIVPTPSRARDVWGTKTQIEQALQAVAPSDLVDSGSLQLSPIISDQRLLTAPLHRNILFSVANNFSGLNALPKESVIDFLQRETSHELYTMIKSCQEYYTSQAVALNLFRAAIEVGNAIAVDFFLRESWPGIEVNSFICSYRGIRCTPVERASALLHKDVVKVLLGHGADVTKYDREQQWPSTTRGALNSAANGMEDSWGSTRLVGMDPELFEMLVEAGGKLQRGYFRVVVHSELSGWFVCLVLKKHAVEDHKIWTKYGLFCDIFRYQSRETCLRTLTTMVQIGADLNYHHRIRGDGGRTIVDIAAGRGELDLVRRMFEAGAVLSHDTLPCAISSGNIQLIYHLLGVGARIDTIGSLQITPLAAAIRSQNQRLVDLVVDHDGEANLGTSIYFRSALNAASEAGNAKWIHRLVNIGGVVLPGDLGMALSFCAERGQTDSAITLIDAGADTNFKGNGDCSGPPLLAALKGQDSILVRALLDADANPNYSSDPYSVQDDRAPAIELAMKWGNRKVIVDILRAGADPNDCGEFVGAKPVLNIAIEGRDQDMMEFLLNAGCDINNPKARLQGATALRAAVKTGDRDFIADILDRGADPHDPSAIDDAISKNSAILDLLLQKHASRYPRGRKGWGGKSLVVALKLGDHGLFTKLLHAGADANQFVGDSTALGHAIAYVKNGDVSFVELLLNSNRQPGCRPETIVSRTPGTQGSCQNIHSAGASVSAFLAAIGSGNMATIKAMLLHNADVNFPANCGVKRTPLQRAVEVGKMEVVELLLKQGADVNAPASKRGGGTALQLAAHGGFIPIFRLLRQHKANLHAPASKVNGRSPLEGAAEMGRLDMVAELLKSGAASHGKDIAQLNRAISLSEMHGHLSLANMLKRFVDEGKVSDGPPSFSEFWTLSDEEMED